jgi:hypothetical protein
MSCTYTRHVQGYGYTSVSYGEVCDVAGNCLCDPYAADYTVFAPCTYFDGYSAPAALDPVEPQVSRDSAADSCSLAGDNGWCRGTQTAGFKGFDEVSGAASPCPAILFTFICNFTRSSSTQGSAVTISSGQVCDQAGNCNAGIDAGPFKIDSTGPTLAPTVGSGPILLNGSASATPHASDANSGVASQSCDPVDTSTAGVHSVRCSAKDNAGNVTTAPVGYLVEYKLLGFFSPAANARLRRATTVGVAVAIADAHGVRIPDSDAQGLLSRPCRVTFSASGAQSASACMTYYKTSKEFRYSWRLGQQTGNVTIHVTVSYPGTTSTTTLSDPIVVTN